METRPRAPNVTEQLREEIVAAYAKGDRVAVIAARHNIDSSTVYRQLQRSNKSPGRKQVYTDESLLQAAAELGSVYVTGIARKVGMNASYAGKRIDKAIMKAIRFYLDAQTAKAPE